MGFQQLRQMEKMTRYKDTIQDDNNNNNRRTIHIYTLLNVVFYYFHWHCHCLPTTRVVRWWIRAQRRRSSSLSAPTTIRKLNKETRESPFTSFITYSIQNIVCECCGLIRTSNLLHRNARKWHKRRRNSEEKGQISRMWNCTRTFVQMELKSLSLLLKSRKRFLYAMLINLYGKLIIHCVGVSNKETNRKGRHSKNIDCNDLLYQP